MRLAAAAGSLYNRSLQHEAAYCCTKSLQQMTMRLPTTAGILSQVTMRLPPAAGTLSSRWPWGCPLLQEVSPAIYRKAASHNRAATHGCGGVLVDELLVDVIRVLQLLAPLQSTTNNYSETHMFLRCLWHILHQNMENKIEQPRWNKPPLS